jgi:hypothetical protein
MIELVIKVQQTAEGWYYASTELDTKTLIVSWGYTKEEVKQSLIQAIMFRTGLKFSHIQLIEQ